MSWVCKLSPLAAKQFKKLPRDRQVRLGNAINEMSVDPVAGDIRPIKTGKFRGALRKRLGHYRIIFSLDPDHFMVEIVVILYRTDTTYN